MQNLIISFQDGINENSDRILKWYDGCVHNTCTIGYTHETIHYKHYTVE